MLQESIGNTSCRTTMIAHVSPSLPFYAETLATVQLATRLHRLRKRKGKVSTSLMLEATLLIAKQILNCICVFNIGGFDTLLILLKRAFGKRKINQSLYKGHVFLIKMFVVLLALITFVARLLYAANNEIGYQVLHYRKIFIPFSLSPPCLISSFHHQIPPFG